MTMIPTSEPKRVSLPHGRVFNFSAGPGMLPTEILEEAKEDFLNYKGCGMSVMELSHRGKIYDEIHMQALQDLRTLMNVPDDWAVLMLQGGASLENALVPLNLKMEGKTPNYIDTGYWGHKSIKDAKKICKIHLAYTSEPSNFDHAPDDNQPEFTEDVSYIYFTSNETIGGVDFLRDPDFGVKDALIVCDASSNILSREFDLTKYDVIFAGAQKNQGPAGVATVIVSPRALEVAKSQDLPLMFSWVDAHKDHSIHNTPPCFTIYMCGLYYKWLIRNGGVKWIAPINERKAKYIYDAIDNSGGFYKGHARKENRSLMNITFQLPNEELTEKFLSEAKEHGMVTLKGHRSTGGVRASMYNAFPEEGAKLLGDFMNDFVSRYG